MVRSRASLQNTGHSIGKHQAWVWCLLCPNAPNPWAELLSHSWNLSYSILSREQGTQLTAVWTPLFPSLRSLVGPLITSRKYVNLVLIGETAGITTRSGNTCVWLSLKFSGIFHSWNWKGEAGHLADRAHACFIWKEPVPTEASSPSPGAPSCYQRAYSQPRSVVRSYSICSRQTLTYGVLCLFVFWLKFSAKWFSCVWQWQAEQQQRN